MIPLAANSTFGGVHDFFQSGTWFVIRNLAILFVIVFWLGVAFWVYKDAEAMLAGLSAAGSTLIATRSSNPRSLDEGDLAARAEPYFEHVEAVADPARALERARTLGPVLVTGSLYLLADLHGAE